MLRLRDEASKSAEEKEGDCPARIGPEQSAVTIRISWSRNGKGLRSAQASQVVITVREKKVKKLGRARCTKQVRIPYHDPTNRKKEFSDSANGCR